jgi:hypothetical protein
LLSVAACHRTVGIPLPPTKTPGDALIVVALTSTTVQTVYATAVSTSALGLPDVLIRGDLDLFAEEFGCTRDTLGLPPGVQALLDHAAAEPQLPQPIAEQHLSIRQGTVDPWTRPAMTDPRVDDVLRRLMLPARNLCRVAEAALSPSDVSIDYKESGAILFPQFVVPVDDTSALISVDLATLVPAYRSLRGAMHQVWIDGRSPQEIQSGTPLPHQAAFRGDDGQLWLYGREGLYKGTIGGGFTMVADPGLAGTATLSGNTAIRMDGARGGAPFELFLLAVSSAEPSDQQAPRKIRRTLQHFDGMRWSTLDDHVTDLMCDAFGIDCASPERSRVAWVAPGEAMIFGLDSALIAISHYKNATVATSRINGMEQITDLSTVPGIGTLAGTSDGQIFRYDGSGWRSYLSGVETLRPGFFLQLGGAFLYGGGTFDGFGLGQNVPSLGLCPMVPITHQQVLAIAPLPNGAVFLEDPRFETGLPITTLSVARGVDFCQGPTPR